MYSVTLNQPVVIVTGLNTYFNGTVTKLDGELIEVTDRYNNIHRFNKYSNRRNWKSNNIHFRTDIDRYLAETKDLSLRFGEDEWMTDPAPEFLTIEQYANTFQPDAFGQDLI